jgi:tRNA nucleotidyltransferase (CCA-adding enzyme)
MWPKHRGHEKAGVKLVKKLAKRLKIPNRFTDLACLGSEYHLHAHKAFELRPDTILRLLQAFDFFRRPERFDHYLDVCEADFRGRTGFEQKDYPQRPYFEAIASACRDISLDQATIQNLEGKARGEFINASRVETIAAVKASYS